MSLHSKTKILLGLFFFDESTTSHYRTIIANLEKKLPNFTPLFIEGMNAFLPAIKNYVSTCKEQYIITTGLDNDDCLSTTFIDQIQKQFSGQDFMAVDFIDGYTVQVSPDIKIGKKLHLYNPFISLIEKNENSVTVCNVSHRLWKKEKRILTIKNNRIWSSIIHLENKVNEFTGYGNVSTEEFLENFKVSETKKLDITNNNIPNNKWLLQNLYNRLTSHWNVIFKTLKKNLGFYNK